MKSQPLTDWLLISESAATVPVPHTPDTDAWLPVQVPTTAQQALVDAGQAPTPWLDYASEWFRSVENDAWLYRTEFAPDDALRECDRFELVFEGVNVLSTVWLNGTVVGTTHNALHEHRFDVTQYVNRDGENALVVECRIGIEEIGRRSRKDLTDGEDQTRLHVRMPQFMFGWDFAPRLPLAGLWRPVSLVGQAAGTISDLHVRTETAQDDHAEIEVEAATRRFTDGNEPRTLALSIHEAPDGPAIWEETVRINGDATVRIPVEIADPKLWWPRSHGEPFLYTLRARLLDGDTTLDEHATRFGIRTVELVQEDSFTFRINGTDVFAKGANWVPADSLAIAPSHERYEHLLELAADANHNMLRVWGGGIYEPERFYELCDELGIMVWQDFMYACAMYPDDDPAFVASADAEARSVVTRLRRHPSVVLWCGNNECQEAWVLGDWAERSRRHLGERLYDHVLPNAVRDLSPDVPYWPGSPFGGPTTRSRTEGDFHDWYSLPNWRTYDENAPLFSSEYGFRAMPERATLDAAISGDMQWEPRPPQHHVWKHHHGWCGWMNSVLPEFGTAETLDEYIMLTQEAQATLMRYAIEVYRRRMFGTSGSLIWMYNEPWPAITFSVVDYFGRQKAAYQWVRRAYERVMVMVYARDGVTSCWGVSDLGEDVSCELRLRRFDHSGTLLGESRVAGSLGANASTCLVENLPDELRIERPADEFIVAELLAGEHNSERTYHVADRRDWTLADVGLHVEIERVAPGRIRATLSADGYAHFVSLSVGDQTARYSDNFVDLLPGEPRSVEVVTEDCGEVTVRSGNAGGAVVATVPIPAAG